MDSLILQCFVEFCWWGAAALVGASWWPFVSHLLVVVVVATVYGVVLAGLACFGSSTHLWYVGLKP